MEAILRWQQYGSADVDAPVALMLHGFMGQGEDWRPVVERMSPALRYLCPDLPGHGALRHDEVNAAAGMPEIAEALLAELNARSVGQCVLAGYSMGGRLALYVALRHPQRFSHLILESASPGLRSVEERRARGKQEEALEQRLVVMEDADRAFETFLRTWYRQPLFITLSRQPELLETLIRRRMENHPATMAVVMRSLGVSSQPSLWDELPKLTLPTLLITGDSDEKYCRLAAEMKALMPCATREVIEGCSHIPHLERPDAYCKAVKRFLDLRQRGVIA